MVYLFFSLKCSFVIIKIIRNQAINNVADPSLKLLVVLNLTGTHPLSSNLRWDITIPGIDVGIIVDGSIRWWSLVSIVILGIVWNLGKDPVESSPRRTWISFVWLRGVITTTKDIFWLWVIWSDIHHLEGSSWRRRGIKQTWTHIGET